MDATQRFLLNVKRHAEPTGDSDERGRWYRMEFGNYGVLVKLSRSPGPIEVLDTYTYNS